jgi:murein DD-endopeptidase MepM/ murein hydrolase activator NlpD
VRLVVLQRRAAGAFSINLSGPWLFGLCSVVLVSLMLGAFFAGLQLGSSAGVLGDGSPTSIARTALQQKAELDELRHRVQERVDSMSARVGQLNAHIIRLDALGKRLAEMADVDSREFDFSTVPSSGGPETDSGVRPEAPDLAAMIDHFESRLAQRDSQLGVLEQLILQRELRRQTVPEGRPVLRGFMSSGFGVRPDPLSGEFAFHRGIDFAGNVGDTVVAVGAGVVTFSGYKPDYGYVVDVTHGDGYVTRYAHNDRVLVKQGETVSRGQRVAIMGSTGRSTGPHVHFEVLRNGTPVNPLSYIGG